MYRLIFRAFLTRLDAETAHHLSFSALRFIDRLPGGGALLAGLFTNSAAHTHTVLGLRFPNQIGLAAGFDKNGRGIRALSRLGFGHIEVGTVTAHAQPGNPRPRLFRLLHNDAVLNRMGFNNDGCRQVAAYVKTQRKLLRALPVQRRPVVGINIGKTKVVDARDAVSDYVTSTRFLAPVADYLVINVSSPNTPGLRDLQAVDQLKPIVQAVIAQARESAPQPTSTLGHVPVLVKIAPDLSDEDVLAVTDMCLETGVDGLICTNTTIDRETLRGRERDFARSEAGGISGRPVAQRSFEVLRLVKKHAGTKLALISVGGIFTQADAQARLAAGADLVQGYTGLIFQGPGFAKKIARALN